jgi:hypothetical protein
MSRDYNKSLLLHADENRANFLHQLVEYRIQYNEDKSNEYFLFLYLASILNYIEAHNGGCLSEVGMMSLKVNIAGTLSKIMEKDENNKIDQQELVRFCLNLLNSYTVCILTKGMFEIAKENDNFFNAYEFPDTIRSEFDELEKTITDLLPTLKSLLITYTIHMDAEHKKVFNLQKNNGFYKQIFTASACKIGGMKGVENAIECR